MTSNNNKSVNSTRYNRWASFYDQYPNPTVAIDELSFPKFWKGLSNLIVLEIGCGTGRHTQKLVAAGNQVTGIDPSAGMLAVAEKKLLGKNVTFVEADFMTYDGLSSDSFDIVLTSLVVEHIENLVDFYRRIGHVLKTGGSLYLSEIHPFRAAQGILAHFKDAETKEEVKLNSYAHTQDQIEAAAKQARFKLVERQDIFGNEELAAIKSGWSKYINLPMIQLWHFQK